MTKIEALRNAVLRFHSALVEADIELHGVMVDHESLMHLKAECDIFTEAVFDPKYKTVRLRISDIPITAGDRTRQAP